MDSGLSAAARDAALSALASRGGNWVDLPVLLPAGPVLELTGEDLRPRLIFAQGPDGAEVCLRPDLTLPAALAMASGRAATGPAAWLHDGKVFRGPRGGAGPAMEVPQIGLERFGDSDPLAADIDVLTATLSAVGAAGVAMDGHHARLDLADGGLLGRVITEADLPEPWAGLLRACRGAPGAVRRALVQARTPSARDASALERTLAGLDAVSARATVAEVIDMAKLTHGGGRSVEAIADRMADRARRALAAPLDAAIAAQLEALIALEGPAMPTLDAVVQAARGLGVDLGDWRAAWDERLRALAAQHPRITATARFEAARPGLFDYYDGLVFDVEAAGASRPVASGGRYDGLVGLLSDGARQMPAVGSVLRPDRIAEALS